MDQAIHARSHFHKGSEISQAGNLPRKDLSLLKPQAFFPGIRLEGLDRKGDPLTVCLIRFNLDHLHLDRLSLLQNFRGPVHSCMRDLGNMDHSLDPSKVHKNPEVGYPCNLSLKFKAGLE